MNKSASESRVQSLVRLEATYRKVPTQLFRNNVGAMKDARGVPVRFGLANDSKLLNAELKSGDLIGWESVLITPDMVGQTFARFLSVECKAQEWSSNPADPHEAAQRRWAALVIAAGGRALIVNAPGSL